MIKYDGSGLDGEMSEDPVKYEPMDEQPETKTEEGMRFVKALSQDDANRSAKQQIRIEALRAAAAINGRILAAVVASGKLDSSITEDATGKSVILLAKQFAAYLESGE